jgi:hypothetical protein
VANTGTPDASPDLTLGYAFAPGATVGESALESADYATLLLLCAHNNKDACDLLAQ